MAVVAEEEDDDDRGRERPLSSEDTARNTKAWRRFWSSSSEAAASSFIPVSALMPKTNTLDGFVREFGEEEGVFEEDAFFMVVVQVSSNTIPTTTIWYTRKRANAAGRCGGQKICSALLFFFFYFLYYYRVISHELPGFVVSVDYFVIAQMSPVFPMRVGGDFKICKRPQRSYDTQRDDVPHPPLYALFVSHPPEFPL